MAGPAHVTRNDAARLINAVRSSLRAVTTMSADQAYAATVTRSDDDSKFGFYKRPSRATVEISDRTED